MSQQEGLWKLIFLEKKVDSIQQMLKEIKEILMERKAEEEEAKNNVNNNNKRKPEEPKKEEEPNKQAKTGLSATLERFLNGEPPLEEGKDERYDKIWDKLCNLAFIGKEAKKVTEEELLYLFQAWSAPDSYEPGDGWLKYCVEKCNQGDILCLAK